MPLHFDFLLVGAGQCNVPLAHALAEAGHRVGVAERQHVGGSCVNFGCTPTKAVLAAAHLAHRARRAADFGLRIPTVEADLPAVLAKARAISEDFRTNIADGFAEAEGITLLAGHARLTGRDGGRFHLTVADEPVTADRVVIDTGTRTLIPSIEGLRKIPFLDPGNWLRRDDLPERLVIVGGGSIGVEMAQFYRRMGAAEVTVVESSGHILSEEDGDVAEALQEALAGEGIRFRLDAEAERVEPRDGGFRLHLDDDGGPVEGTHLFLAVGRTPNTADLGLDTVGLDVDDDGTIPVDGALRTRVGGVWAVGDVRGGPQFTHTAHDDHRIIRDHLFGPGERSRDDRLVPYAVYTDPTLGRAGMTEAEAREAGRTVRVGRKPMEENGRAIEERQTAGFAKVVVDADTDEVLGAALLGVGASEAVHLVVGAMQAGVTATALRRSLPIHPTVAEALVSALEDAA